MLIRQQNVVKLNFILCVLTQRQKENILKVITELQAKPLEFSLLHVIPVLSGFMILLTFNNHRLPAVTVKPGPTCITRSGFVWIILLLHAATHE